MKSRRILFYLFVVFFIIGVSGISCKKDEGDEIPYVYVNFSINPSSIEYNDLDIPGNFAYVTGGYHGIILYHYIQSEYIAYERACTFDPLDVNSHVDVGEDMMVITCPVCGSKYLIIDGSPFDGPAIRSLKQYRTHYDGNYLYVSN